ncbi:MULTISPECIES: integrase [unclassified Sporosarcina]|uniref:integrase n=1 Tax=unclassified Sporosarcina TaxID=2647733 RepID=UPI00203D7AFE|nr:MULTISPECIES: integrase [unclassified Sporosarcina]GKV65009.1 hypothetical protein NCCP2331_11620 [Sporosarcina sp. NCCP-2331]GLB56644.1 hypothetical protein NCCP2378_24310 [Sporosarcina sp. NCCP-2378]
MNNQLVSNHLQGLIAGVMEKVQMNIPLREVSDGINMSYNFIGKYIGYDPKRLASAHKEMAAFCSADIYVQAITLHELGHVMDQEALEASLPRTIEIFTMRKSYSMSEIYKNAELLAMLIEEDEMNKVFEETAWENAACLNDQFRLIDPAHFKEIRKNSLATYEAVYEEDVSYYKKLTNQTEDISRL